MLCICWEKTFICDVLSIPLFSGLLLFRLRNSCFFLHSPPCHLRLVHPEESKGKVKNNNNNTKAKKQKKPLPLSLRLFPFYSSLKNEMSECLGNVANPLSRLSWGLVVSSKATMNSCGSVLQCSDSNQNVPQLWSKIYAKVQLLTF